MAHEVLIVNTVTTKMCSVVDLMIFRALKPLHLYAYAIFEGPGAEN